MQMGFYFDQTRCIGCHTCAVACKDWHDIPAGPANWMRVISIEEGKFPNLSLAYLCAFCYHCAQPACIESCPAEAISKRKEDGVVLVDREKCLGKQICGAACLRACPYEAPQFGTQDNPKMEKCGLCIDRLNQNKQPICVASCPTRALNSGPINELKRKYGQVREAQGFVYATQLDPSIIFKPKKGVDR